jgi:hypothetical protein
MDKKAPLLLKPFDPIDFGYLINTRKKRPAWTLPTSTSALASRTTKSEYIYNYIQHASELYGSCCWNSHAEDRQGPSHDSESASYRPQGKAKSVNQRQVYGVTGKEHIIYHRYFKEAKEPGVWHGRRATLAILFFLTSDPLELDIFFMLLTTLI